MSKVTKIILWIIVAVIIIGGIWYGISRKSAPAPTANKPIKIGAILPLTGEIASWGQNGLAGIKLALQEINNKGGVDGRKLALAVEDSKCNADSVSAVQKLINIDKVNAIVVFVCSSAAGPALPITKNNDVPTVMIAASAPRLTKVGDNIFRVYPSDAVQGKVGAEFIYNKLGKKKVAVIYVENDWGEGIQGVFIKRFKELGGQVVYTGGILQTDTDLRTEITKAKESGAEALYSPVFPNNATAGFKQMKEMGFRIPIVGGDSFNGEEVVGSGYADGGIYTVPKVNLPENFKRKIKNLSGFANLKVSVAAPLGYDGIKIMSLAIKDAHSIDKENVKQELVKIKYHGVSSPMIEFDENGDLKTPIFEVKVIKDKKSVPYEK